MDEMKVGDKVKISSDSEGIIVRINEKTLDWCKYKVKITKPNKFFFKKGQILGFKKEQLTLIEV